MDTITHGLLGATIAQLGFRQRIGRDATWIATLAAVVPDLDILTRPLLNLTGSEDDGFSTIASHRGITHSLLVIPLVALAVALAWRWFRRIPNDKSDQQSSPPFLILFLCVLLPMLCHPLLDWMTSYGTQLLTPLSHRRFALDAIAIVDMIYSPILILTLLTCWIIRRVRGNGKKATLVAGWIGFGLSVLYLLAGFGIHHHVMKKGQTLSTRPAAIGEVHAYPQLGTIFVWRVTHNDPTGWAVGKINVLLESKPDSSTVSRVPEADNEWVRLARQIPEVQKFDWFTMGQNRAAYTHLDHRHIIEFFDMRYGIRTQSIDSLWSMRVTFNELTRTSTVDYVHHPHGLSIKTFALRAWRDIWNK